MSTADIYLNRATSALGCRLGPVQDGWSDGCVTHDDLDWPCDAAGALARQIEDAAELHGLIREDSGAGSAVRWALGLQLVRDGRIGDPGARCAVMSEWEVQP